MKYLRIIVLIVTLAQSCLSFAQTGAPPTPNRQADGEIDSALNAADNAEQSSDEEADSLPPRDEALDAASEKSTPVTAEQPAESVRKTSPQDKVFRPSEEISEDLPVPFPVDI